MAPPRISVKTNVSRPLPTINAASSSANTVGNGTEGRSCVWGVPDQTAGLGDRAGYIDAAAQHVEIAHP